MHVTPDALAVETPIWMVGDSAYDTLDWHDYLADRRDRASHPYNPRNTNDPFDIEYRVEDRIEFHSEDVQLKQSVLDETYNRRTQVQRTNGASKNCGLRHARTRGRVHARVQVFLALCLRLVVAITNDEQGDNLGREMLKYEESSMTRSLLRQYILQRTLPRPLPQFSRVTTRVSVGGPIRYETPLMKCAIDSAIASNVCSANPSRLVFLLIHAYSTSFSSNDSTIVLTWRVYVLYIDNHRPQIYS